MSDLPIIYTIRLDMTEEVHEEANRWNNTAHISDLLGAGFLSAVRYRAIKGEPKYMHVYELPNVELLQTEAYANVRKNDPWGPKLSHGFSNHSASLYRQEVALQVPETPRTFPTPRTSSMGGVKGKYVITVRMDVVPDGGDELIRWHREEHIPMLLEAKGAINGRLGRHCAIHPRTPCLDPEWVAIYELDSLEFLEDPKVKAANETEWAKKMHTKTSDVRFSVAERIFPQ